MKKLFRIDEHFNGYSITHVPTNKIIGSALSPGTETFRKKWEREFNSNVAETMEAYFPEEFDKTDA